MVIVDRDEEGASRQAGALTAAGHQATHATLDLADEQSIVRGCAEIVRSVGVTWALINNAGLQNRELLLEGTSQFWDLNFSVNARGPFLMTREVARAMVEAKQGGRIVHIASTALIGQIAFGHALRLCSLCGVESGPARPRPIACHGTGRACDHRQHAAPGRRDDPRQRERTRPGAARSRHAAMSAARPSNFNACGMKECIEDMPMRGCFLPPDDDLTVFRRVHGIPYTLLLDFNRLGALTDITFAVITSAHLR
jgi:NAD(P)-dependent dehydrogenase (short-subunit alcohol dehydrogenase family)